MLFSDWQPSTQALQPVQVFRSTAMPHLWPVYSHSFQSEISGGLWMPRWSTKCGSFAVLLERAFAHQAGHALLDLGGADLVDGVVVLRRGQPVLAAGLAQLQAVAAVQPVPGAQLVGVEAGVLPDAAGVVAAVTQRSASPSAAPGPGST